MKKNYIVFYSGMLLGILFIELTKSKYSLTEYFLFVTFLMLLTHEKISEFLNIIFLLTTILVFPFFWVSSFKWYDLLIELWLIYFILFNVFKNTEKSILVDEGNILLFPPKFMEEKS